MNKPETCPACGYDGDDMRPMRNLSNPEDRTIYGHECGYCGAQIEPDGSSHSAAAVERLRGAMDAARDRRLFG